ncbi:MAG: hypothetical protein IJR71_00410 [Prevotella sp.]|nr:hypothetical protein [Prevotella sp.]
MTKEIIINGKALYTPKGAAREYAPVGCNLYTGCKHDCFYCYLKRGVLSHAMGGTEIKLKSCFKDDIDAGVVFTKELEKHLSYLQKVGIFFSFSTDPLISETRDLTKRCVVTANRNGVPVKLLTKNADFVHDEVFMSWLKVHDFRKDLVAFGFTLTGHDEMEQFASYNADRIAAMKELHEMGFKTFASIEPIIDVPSSLDMIKQTVKFCDLYKVGLRSGVKKDYYQDEDLLLLIKELATLHDTMGTNIYIKKSLRERLQHPIIGCISVGPDYNLFTNK